MIKQTRNTDVQSYYDLLSTLRERGAQVSRIGFVSHPLFRIGGMVLTINKHQVQVYEYTDINARIRDLKGLLPKENYRHKSQFKSHSPQWVWSKGALIVLYSGSEGSILDLMTIALGSSPIDCANGTVLN